MSKYTARKLVFILVLATLIATPFGIQAYLSATTTDPYILMAREIEQFEKGGVDVLNVEENRDVGDGVIILAYIESYPEWSLRQDQLNFNQHILRVIARYDFESASILIGWDFPPEDFRIQGAWVCEELRRGSCTWEKVASVIVRSEFIQWPGIGKP